MPKVNGTGSATGDTGTDGSSARFATPAVPLLKEYTAKLIEWRQHALEPLSTGRPYQIQRLWQRFRPAGLDFARQISGMVEQGDLPLLDRVELRLRLAEFEAALTEVEGVLNKLG